MENARARDRRKPTRTAAGRPIVPLRGPPQAPLRGEAPPSASSAPRTPRAQTATGMDVDEVLNPRAARTVHRTLRGVDPTLSSSASRRASMNSLASIQAYSVAHSHSANPSHAGRALLRSPRAPTPPPPPFSPVQREREVLDREREARARAARMSTREPVEFSALPFQLYAPSAADRQMKVYTSHLRDKVPFGKYTPPAPFGSASTSETMPQEGAHVAKKPRKEFVVRFDTPPTP